MKQVGSQLYKEVKSDDDLFDPEKYRRPGEAGKINRAEPPEGAEREIWLQGVVDYISADIISYAKSEFDEQNVIDRYFIDSDWFDKKQIEKMDWADFPFDEEDNVDIRNGADAWNRIVELYNLDDEDNFDKFKETIVNLLGYAGDMWVCGNPSGGETEIQIDHEIGNEPWYGSYPLGSECEELANRINEKVYEDSKNEVACYLDEKDFERLSKMTHPNITTTIAGDAPDIMIDSWKLKDELNSAFDKKSKVGLRGNISVIQTIKTTSGIYSKETEDNQNHIKFIKNPTIYGIGNILLNKFHVDPNSKIDIRDLKKYSKSDFALSQLFTKKDGKALIQKYQSGFSIQDLIAFDTTLPKMIAPGSVPDIIGENFYNIGITTEWKSKIQRVFDTKNYVFQMNIKPELLPELLNKLGSGTYAGQKQKKELTDNINSYIKASNHPTSKKTLTYSWIRYSVPEKGKLPSKLANNSDEPDENRDKWNGVVLDEIQTDIDDDNFLGPKLMKGWDTVTLRAFIKYVRKNLGIQNIYIPTYETKLNAYGANPPMYLYKELPNMFGFQKSNKEGFLLLENVK